MEEEQYRKESFSEFSLYHDVSSGRSLGEYLVISRWVYLKEMCPLAEIRSV